MTEHLAAHDVERLLGNPGSLLCAQILQRHTTNTEKLRLATDRRRGVGAIGSGGRESTLTIAAGRETGGRRR